MRKFTLKKRNGTSRTIYAPSKEEREVLEAFIDPLTNLAKQICNPKVVHGFMPGRSCTSNAMQHVGRKYSLCFDLKDFFDSVTQAMTEQALLKGDFWNRFNERISERQDLLFPDGAARQGLPTSPIIANIAAAPMDKEILALISNPPAPRRAFDDAKEIKRDCVYTRYADDLTFSFDATFWIYELKQKIPELVKRHGFEINPSKTRVQAARAGRRIITGIAVCKTKIHPTRASKRRLRAAIHQGHISEAKGLKEWCKVRLPKQWKRDLATEEAAKRWANTIPAPKPPKAKKTPKTEENQNRPLKNRFIDLA